MSGHWTPPRQLVKNTDDPEQVRDADRKERESDGDLRDCWREVLASPAGRRVVHEMIRVCGVWEPWTPGTDIHFFEGARYMGLRLIQTVNETGNTLLTKMMDEARIREERR